MAKLIALLVLSAQLLNIVAECPNACSAHGKCTAFDMCLCYRNWMSNDCSERVCQFGLAHVDSPKGDLDSSSGALSGPSSKVITNSFVYTHGTTEQFPSMVDSAGNVLENTAHYYMECSNKGLCDRSSGSCECFPGYEGSACQRASCPSGDGGMCSGHGTCHTIREIAELDNGNVYELWDKHASMGCVCDAGYSGPSCAERSCKYGIDPLYVDDMIATPRISNWTFAIYYNTPASGTVTVSGTYSLIFYDVFGEDWETDPIAHDAQCDAVITALESIPNNVIPHNSVLCLGNDDQPTGNALPNSFLDTIGNSGGTFTIWRNFILAFPGNPGELKPLAVNFFLDGTRPTLQTTETDTPYSLKSRVYADGFHGEFADSVPDLCEDVIVTLTTDPVNAVAAGTVGTFITSATGSAAYTRWVLSDLDSRETQRLKRCLGDSDGITTQTSYEQGEVYNWDFGSLEFPHLIKLVDTAAHNMVRLCNSTNTYNAYKNSIEWCEYSQPAGIYLPLVYESATSKFVVYGTKGLTAYTTTSAKFNVFTTTGYLETVNGFKKQTISGVDYKEQSSANKKDYSFVESHYPNGLYMKPLSAVDSGDVHWVGPNIPVGGSTNAHGTTTATIDCENWNDRPVADRGYGTCIEKGDKIMMWNYLWDQDDITKPTPLYHNMYTVEKIFLDRDQTSANPDEWTQQGTIIFDKRPNFYESLATVKANLLAWKFQWPSTSAGPVEYVAECSGRGLCNSDSGICECFTGHTGDDCSIQNTLAK